VFRAHEARLKASRYGFIRLNFDSHRLERRLRSLSFDDFVEAIADWMDSFAFCRRYYQDGNLGPVDPLPADASVADRQQSNAEVVLIAMINAIFALTARAVVTREVLGQWATGAANAGLSAIITMVVYAITLARSLPRTASPRNRVSSYSVWETAVFVLNVLAFVLMGLQSRPILDRLSEAGRMEALILGVAVLAECLATQAIDRFLADKPEKMLMFPAGGGFLIRNSPGAEPACLNQGVRVVG